MVLRKFMGIFAITLIIGAGSLAMAGIPDVNNCTATRAYTGVEKLVVLVVPGGDADSPIDEAVVFAPAQPNLPGVGLPQVIQDGTITVTVKDGAAPPAIIVNYPREDVWIVNAGVGLEPGLLPCTGGATADAPTDVSGLCFFANPVAGGGYTTGATTVIINGNAVPGTIDLSFNSPDSNGDGFINGIDLQAFSADFYGYALVPAPSTYNFRGDLFHDGVVSGADLQNFSSHFGKTCD